MDMPPFRDRKDAGQQLAQKLGAYAERKDVIVLGLPRGGVVVAYEVARALDVPLDIFLVRKLGAPWNEELAMGAIASGGVRVLNQDVVRGLGVSPETIERVVEREQEVLKQREQAYRGDRPPPDAQGRTVILVDDGLATGASMRAAITALRARGPARIVVAVPTAPPETCAEFQAEVDEMVCLHTPWDFVGVSGSYMDFRQTTDAEVRALLAESWAPIHGGPTQSS
jgi:putative phosphoribosyl transferase